MTKGTNSGTASGDRRFRALNFMACNTAALFSLLLMVIGTPPARAQESIDQMAGSEHPELEQIAAQIQSQEYDYPIRWLNQHIESVEHSYNRYDRKLIRPLVLLGDAKIGKGDYDGAIDDYQRAVHLTRVNDGLNAASQVQIVYREADAYKALGDYKDANDQEEYAYHVLTRVHDSDDEALLPGVFHLAKWYSDTHNIFSARALYEHAIGILAANGKQSTATAIPAYRGIAQTYRLERFPPFYIAAQAEPISKSQFSPSYVDPIKVNNFPAGERALQEIVQIYREDPNVDPQVLADSILDLADWYLLFDKTSRAFPLYGYVYKLLSDVNGFAVADYFAKPKLLYFPIPEAPRPPPVDERGERKKGFVEIAFDVSQNGYTGSFKTIASEPEGLMDYRVRKSLRLARYRPPVVDGQPVAKDDQVFRHEFTYYTRVQKQAISEGSQGD